MKWPQDFEPYSELICVPCGLKKGGHAPRKVQYWLEDQCDLCGKITQVCHISEFGLQHIAEKCPQDFYRKTDS